MMLWNLIFLFFLFFVFWGLLIDLIIQKLKISFHNLLILHSFCVGLIGFIKLIIRSSESLSPSLFFILFPHFLDFFQMRDSEAIFDSLMSDIPGFPIFNLHGHFLEEVLS